MELRRGKSGEYVFVLVLKEAPLVFCYFLCLLSICSLALMVCNSYGTDPSDVRNPAARRRTFSFIQGQDRGRSTATTAKRRYLGGPGSYPPRCSSKCGNCTPCRPVHVAVPPGTPVTTEYYPEAWRCMCGNRLYMP